MEVDLPEERIIEVIYDDTTGAYLWFYDEDTLDFWQVSEDMIEEFIDENPGNII